MTQDPKNETESELHPTSGGSSLRPVGTGVGAAIGTAKLAWAQAKHATSDAWHRLQGTGRDQS